MVKSALKWMGSGIAVCLVAAWLPAAAAQPALTDIGENLLGEHCELRERDDVAPLAGLPVDGLVYCETKLAGQVYYDRYAAPGKADIAAARIAMLAQYGRSRPQRLLAARLSCGEPAWPEQQGAVSVAVFPCQLKSGGWPQLLVLGFNKDVLTVVEAAPAMLPVLLKAVGASSTAMQAAEGKAFLQALWKKTVVLVSASDLARFRQLISDGRNASTNLDFVQAEDSLRKALELQSAFLSENDPSIADTLMDIALNASNQGKDDEAQALFLRAEAIVQKSPFETDRARLASYRGYEAANRGDYDGALKNAKAASAAWRKLAAGNSVQGLLRADDGGNQQERAELAMALNFEALMALRNEDIESASAVASEALLTLTPLESAPLWWKADVMMTLGEISIVQGRLSAAEKYFNAALAIRQRVFGDGAMTLPVQAALGKAYQREGMNSSAIITYRELFKSARLLPSTSAKLSNEQLVPFGAAIADYAATLKSEDERQGLYAEAFDAFQLSRSGLIDKTIAKAQARLGSDDPKIAALVDELQSSQRQIETARVSLASEQALPDQDRSANVESRLQKEMDTQRLRVKSLDQDLRTQFPGYHQLANPKPIALLDMRQRLGDREALVTFIIGKQQSFIQLTRRQGNIVARVDMGESALREAVSKLRRALDVQGGAISEFDLQTAHQLYQSLFGGVELQLKDTDHLIVAASGPLASLPFALLVTSTPVARDYSHAQWLGQRFAISHTPSLASFYALRGVKPRQVPAKMMLAFADPVFEGKQAVQGTVTQPCLPDGPMNSSTLRALSPLPDTAKEVQAVANILGAGTSTVFLRAQASEENFQKQSLQDYRVLYFATHGLLPGELKCQAEPGLVLTPPLQQAQSKAQDGLLAASEIAALKLNADLVVLSACNTAGSGGKLGGEALSGLAESFFFAGARSLVVSHWQVPSAATARLMTGMFTKLGPGLQGGASPALKAAQASLIADKNTAHPFYWAAFVVVGDGLAVPVAPQLSQNGVAQ
jgi:CHAT domain-containing protein